MKRCYLFANPTKENTIAFAEKACEYLAEKGVEVYLDAWLSEKIKFKNVIEPKLYEDIDFAVSIGGDGTLLRLVTKASENAIPVLGVNLGHLGFLLEVDSSEFELAIDNIVNGNYYIEKRMLLDVDVCGNHYFALNDVGLLRASFPGCIFVRTYCNAEEMFTAKGDGVIVTSPTGTTGYALSAGGPVISPELDCFLVQPICTHVLFQRPVVLSSDNVVRLECKVAEGKEYQAVIDGHIVLPLRDRVNISVKKADKQALFIRFKNSSFWHTLRLKKCEWGEE